MVLSPNIVCCAVMHAYYNTCSEALLNFTQQCLLMKAEVVLTIDQSQPISCQSCCKTSVHMIIMYTREFFYD